MMREGENSGSGLRFVKMSGAGNDFVVFLLTELGAFPESAWSGLFCRICRRGLSAGADGVIVLADQGSLVEMRYFNADGREAELCGNGTRCAARYAVEFLGKASPVFLKTRSGVIRSEVTGETVRLEVPCFALGERDEEIVVEGGSTVTGRRIEVGVPHFAVECESVDGIEVEKLGRAIRHNSAFSPRGTNVDFYSVEGGVAIRIRTYERGVERETLACGTGAVAVALCAYYRQRVAFPVTVHTGSGEELVVEASTEDSRPKKVFLSGPARFVYRARLDPEQMVRPGGPGKRKKEDEHV